MSILSAMFFILFFSTFLLANYLFYLAIISFFDIKNNLLRKSVGALIILFATSFVFSFVIIRTSSIEMARWFYIVSSLWGGFMINFFIATIVLFLISFLTRWKKVNINKLILATTLFSLAIIVSIGGIINALNPKVKETEVYISNLPQQWEGKKVAHLSDVHVGPVNRKMFLEKIINKVNKSNADIVLLTGDFFDGDEKGIDFVPEVLNQLNAPLGVYFANGNHENYNHKLNFQKILTEGGVNILDDKVIEIDGLNIMGVSYRGQDEGGLLEMINYLNKGKNDKPTILLYHTPDKVREISKLGIDLQLSGHTHAGQMFPMNIITNIIYKGFNHGLYQIKDYNLYISSGVGTWGPIMRTGNRPEISIIRLNSK